VFDSQVRKSPVRPGPVPDCGEGVRVVRMILGGFIFLAVMWSLPFAAAISESKAERKKEADK